MRRLRSTLGVARSRRGMVGELRLGAELESMLVGALELLWGGNPHDHGHYGGLL